MNRFQKGFFSVLYTIFIYSSFLTVANAQLSLEQLNLIDNIGVSLSRATFNRRTSQQSYTATVTNNGATTVQGSLFLVIDRITSTDVSIANNDEFSTTGLPIFTISVESLTPGASAQINLVFNNPTRTRFSFTSQIFINSPADTTPPDIQITSPLNGALFNQSSVTITGTVTDENTVTVSVNGISAMVIDGDFSVNISLIQGINNLIATAMDAAGNTASVSIQVTFQAEPNNISPSVSIISPANMSLLNSNTITVSGTVDDATTTVSINGITATVLSNNLPTFTAEISLSEGNNTITAVAEDTSGKVGSATIQVMRDTTAPRITIDAPIDGATVFSDTVNVTGMVNDIIGGSASDVSPTVTVNGIQARVVNRSFLAQNVPLVIGDNSITVVATDQLGNSTTANINTIYQIPQGKKIDQVSGQHQRGQIVTVLPEQLIVKLLDENSQPVANTNVVFRVIQGDGLLGESQNEARGQVISTNSEGNAGIQFRLGSRAGEGNQRVRAKAVGFEGEVIFNASAIANPGDKINILSGDRQSGVINRPLPHELTVAVTDNGANMIPNSPVQFEVTVGEGVFANGESVFETVTDNNGVASAEWTLGSEVGRGLHRVTATLTGTSAFAGFVASGFIAGLVEETTVSGVVLNNQDTSMPGVTIQIRDTNLETTTDAEGQFRLSNAPVGNLHLIANGSTTTLPGVWPTLSFEMVSIAGVENKLPSPIYLLPLDTEGGVMAGAQDVELTLPEVPGFKLIVKAGTVTFPNGATTGLISVTPVNANKIPMPPPNGMQPQFIVTIQPAGAIFDPPAPLTLPNVDGHPPGAEVEMYSFDHDLEAFVTIGLGTVNADGTVIESNHGIGVLKTGWHCGSQPGGTGCLHNCPQCLECKSPECNCNITINEEGSCDLGGEGCVVSTCVGGECKEIGNVNSGSACIDDGNTCTTEVCDGNGNCIHTNVEDGLECEIDNASCRVMICENGMCVTSESNAPDGESCDSDQNECTRGFCSQGTCLDGTSNGSDIGKACEDDGNPCTENTCQLIRGELQCQSEPIPLCEDSDEDGVPDNKDKYPNDNKLCGIDVDSDRCDDCTSGKLDSFNDGPDADSDGVCNKIDNCLYTQNPDQNDSNSNFIGDACESCESIEAKIAKDNLAQSLNVAQKGLQILSSQRIEFSIALVDGKRTFSPAGTLQTLIDCFKLLNLPGCLFSLVRIDPISILLSETAFAIKNTYIFELSLAIGLIDDRISDANQFRKQLEKFSCNDDTTATLFNIQRQLIIDAGDFRLKLLELDNILSSF